MKQQTVPDYEQYRQTQVEANVRKFQNIWATPTEMNAVASLIRNHVTHARFGLCHGARNGQEVRLLGDQLGHSVRVLGTDISPTANAIASMVQWDFHELNADWTGQTDFIYSNSWDHSYDIDKLARAWAQTLRPGGLAIIHWTRFHTEAGMNHGPDIFGSGEDEIASTFTNAGLCEVERVRIERTASTDGILVDVPVVANAPHSTQGIVKAHYVEHDGDVVLIALKKNE